MDIRIKAIHFDVNERLQDFIEKKVSKLGRFESEIGKVEVSLKVVKPESAMNKQADIKVEVPGKSLFVSETCDTFEEAVDNTCEILGRQIEKYKNK
jgi:putative sigma-54 modulation protein